MIPQDSGSSGRRKWTANPTSTQPMSFRTQIIHSPERGSFSRLPLNMARKNRGNPSPRLRAEKHREPQPCRSLAGHPGEQTQDKWADAGRRDQAQSQTHEQGAQKPGIGFRCRLGQTLGQAQLPEAEQAGGENQQNSAAISTSTTGFCSMAPMSPPVRAADTPRTVLVTAKPAR